MRRVLQGSQQADTGSFVMGNKPVGEMWVCATVAEQHNKGVVTWEREEFPRDRLNVFNRYWEEATHI